MLPLTAETCQSKIWTAHTELHFHLFIYLFTPNLERKNGEQNERKKKAEVYNLGNGRNSIQTNNWGKSVRVRGGKMMEDNLAGGLKAGISERCREI